MSRGVLLKAILANAMALAQWMGGAMLVISNVPAARGEIPLNQHGLTGSWYQPATNGEGIELEVYPNAVAPGVAFLQGGWFTFDNWHWDSYFGQRWYTFGGTAPEAAASATLTLYQNVGGNFNALPVTSAIPVGTVALSFSACTTGKMDYAFTDGSGRIGTIPLTRLTPNVTCSTGDARVPNADFGHSGHWFDPATAGQGFVFEVNPAAEMVFFAWYTYSRDGYLAGEDGQRWFTGQASYTPGSRSLPMSLYETTVAWAHFGSYGTRTSVVGTATATFTSCDAATLTFTFAGGTNGGAAGTINLSRLGPTPPDCR